MPCYLTRISALQKTGEKEFSSKQQRALEG